MASEGEVVNSQSAAGDQQNGEALENNNIVVGGVEIDTGKFEDGRIKRKAKRRIKRSPSQEMQQINGTVQVTRGSKNMRKSRMGKGRGLPKKGGAGGKGTWGAPGSEIFEEGECNDEKDPNYDSDTQFQKKDNYFSNVAPPLSGEELTDYVEPIIQEYFEHGDTSEVAECLEEINIEKQRHELPKLAVTIALEKKAAQREMTSVLISDLYGKRIVTEEQMAAAFDNLLGDLEDLSLDTPDAPQIVGQFIARAVADDCLPPKFISSYKGKVDTDHAQLALNKADTLLSMKHGMVRLDNVWGVGGGIRPVKYLIKKMVLLLKEYLSSGDIIEVERCLQELDVPHFHHELVYEAIVMAIEDTGERAAQSIAKLLKSLYSSVIVTWDQLVRGFQRVFNALPDICLDVPSAYSLMERFADICVTEELMSEKMRARVPVRGRKRFVSEGDGGLVKESVF